MKIRIAVLMSFVLMIALLSYQFTFSFFTDNAVSANNTFATASQFTTPTPTPTQSETPPNEDIADHIVISEVQIDGGVGQANNNDFIELYNPTSSEINIGGYRLVLRTGNSSSDTNIVEFTNSHIIPAKGYFLWAHQSQSNNYATTLNADVSSSDVLGSSNSIALRNGPLNSGVIIDALSWNEGNNALVEGTNFSPNPGINQSMERKAVSSSSVASMVIGGTDELRGNGFDTNNNATDFILRTVSQPQNSSSTAESL